MNNVIDLEDSISLATIARTAGVSLAQAKMVLLGVASLPTEQGDRVIATAREHRVRMMNAVTRKREESEERRREARGESAE